MATSQTSPLVRLALLLLLTGHIDAAVSGCLEGYVAHHGKCFKLYTEPSNVTTARSVCQSGGGHLATVDSDSTNAIFGHMMEDHNVANAWLGGSLKKTGWHWGEGGDYFKYQGCYEKRSSYPMGKLSRGDITVTPLSCIADCRILTETTKYKYAGVTFADTGLTVSCYCFPDFFEDKIYNGCDKKCIADTHMTCGNVNRLQLYSLEGANIIDNWKPLVPTDNYRLNMCSKLTKTRLRHLTLSDAGCVTSLSMGYVCEYGPYDIQTCPVNVWGKCFKVFHIPVTWYKARERCRKDGGRLLQVDTWEFYNDMTKYNYPSEFDSPGVDGWWVGGSNVRWRWQNGHDVLYTNWKYGSPNRKSEACMSMAHPIINPDRLDWEATDCKVKMSFICQHESSTTKYLGCFTKKAAYSNSILPGSTATTPDTCVTACRDNGLTTGYNYAGLAANDQGQLQCYCFADFYDRYTNAECEKQCRGDKSWSCMSNHLRLYHIHDGDWLWWWKPAKTSNKYALNMCSVLQKAARGAAADVSMGDMACSTVKAGTGYMCEYATQKNNCITRAGKCFTASAGPDDGLSWFKANQLCNTAGGRLLQVNTKEFHHYLYNNPGAFNNLKMWVGGSNVRWEWANGQSMFYTNWERGSPMHSNINNACLILKNPAFTWTDVACTKQYRYICERAEPCQTGDVPHDHKCYNLHKVYVTYTEAANKCKEAGGALATVMSEATQEVLNRLLTSNSVEGVWLGGRMKKTGTIVGAHTPRSQWNPWTSWSQCTATCGSGTRERSRTCNTVNNIACPGKGTETKTCLGNVCPPDTPRSQWNTWTSWSQCTATCGSGTRERSRTCNTVNNMACPGKGTETKACLVNVCPPGTGPPIRSGMFTHGKAANDTEIKCSKRSRLGHSRPLLFRHIKLFDFFTDRLVIYSHGYVSLSQRFLKRNPPVNITEAMSTKMKKHARRSGYALLAPFWADSDCTKNSETYYHVYDSKTTAPNPAEKTRTDAIMNLAKEYITKYSHEPDVNPDWVLVVTWVKNLPRSQYDPTRDKPNTFQMVLMSDREKKKTYVVYLYNTTGWDNTVSARSSYLGYYMTHNGKVRSKTLEVSNTTGAFRVADLQGNTGKKGTFFFPLTFSTTSAGHLSCLKWYNAERNILASINQRLGTTTACPCDLSLISKECRWMFDVNRFMSKTGSYTVCFYDRREDTQSTQYCCYNTMGKLIQGNHTRASRLFLYRPSLTEQHRVNDVVPKKWCCDQSNNCDKFHEVRPLRACNDK